MARLYSQRLKSEKRHASHSHSQIHNYLFVPFASRTWSISRINAVLLGRRESAAFAGAYCKALDLVYSRLPR
jgi:hypothetical protein